jgi:hypothetical protein
MEKFRNPYEEDGKWIRRHESDFTKKVGAISPTTEGPGRYWHGSEENREDGLTKSRFVIKVQCKRKRCTRKIN